MAIYIETGNSKELLGKIIDSIENQVVQTWILDGDQDFTHVSQWKDKAWFKSYIQPDNPQRLIFGLIGRRDEAMTKSLYGIYHGRFSEMLLTHFDGSINQLILTPNKVEGYDSFK